MCLHHLWMILFSYYISWFFLSQLQDPPRNPQYCIESVLKWGWGKEGTVGIFVVERHIRWMLLPKHFWDSLCHIGVMTEEAGALLFLPVSLLAHETALRRKEDWFLDAATTFVAEISSVMPSFVLFSFIQLFTNFREIFLVFLKWS